METDHSPAEEFPALYRSILDGVAALERRGQRREAAEARTAATAAYSRSWDERGRRRLVAITRRIERVASGDASPGGTNRSFAFLFGRSPTVR